MLRLTDLREILHYVPRFRGKTFVIALDGAIVEDDNFGNLLLNIVLLHSLRIGVGEFLAADVLGTAEGVFAGHHLRYDPSLGLQRLPLLIAE